MSRSKPVKISPANVTRPGEFRGSLPKFKVGDVVFRASHPQWGHAIILEIDKIAWVFRMKWLSSNKIFTLTSMEEMVHVTKLHKLLAGYDNEN